MAENSWHRYDMKKLRHCHPIDWLITYKPPTSIYYMSQGRIPCYLVNVNYTVHSSRKKFAALACYNCDKNKLILVSCGVLGFGTVSFLRERDSATLLAASRENVRLHDRRKHKRRTVANVAPFTLVSSKCKCVCIQISPNQLGAHINANNVVRNAVVP